MHGAWDAEVTGGLEASARDSCDDQGRGDEAHVSQYTQTERGVPRLREYPWLEVFDMRKLVVAIAAALALPAGAQAADYVGLTVDKTKVAPGWTLAGTHTSGSFYRGDEIFGLTLRRSFLGARGEEQHALRAHPKRSLISFDGRTGRWRTNGQLGSVAAIDMAITSTGTPTPTTDAWGCTGAFVRVPVRLQGALTLRTGTRFFKTIRRATLTGSVTYESGEVSCDRPGAGDLRRPSPRSRPATPQARSRPRHAS